MPTLKHCIDEIFGATLPTAEVNILRAAVKEYRDEGYTGMAANVAAVRDFLDGLHKQRTAIIEEINRQTGRVPVATVKAQSVDQATASDVLAEIRKQVAEREGKAVAEETPQEAQKPQESSVTPDRKKEIQTRLKMIETERRTLHARKEKAYDAQDLEGVKKAEADSKALDKESLDLRNEFHGVTAAGAPKPTDKLKSAADHMKTIAEGIKKLNGLIGERGSFSTDPLDEEIWKQARPILKEMWESAKAAKQDLKDFVSLVLDSLSVKMAPYFERFIQEEFAPKKQGEGYGETEEAVPAGPAPNVEALEEAPASHAGLRAGEGGEALRGEEAGGVPGPGDNEGGLPGDGSGRAGAEGLPGGRGGDVGGRGAPTGRPPGQEPERAGEAQDLEVGGGPDREGGERGRTSNHRIEASDVIVPGGEVARADANIRAINLLQKLEKEDREATPKEKKILAQFSGWGSMSQMVFDHDMDSLLQAEIRNGGNLPAYYRNYTSADRLKKFEKWKEKWAKRLHPDFGGVMSKEEWNSAVNSTLNAHYTSREVIENGLWPIAEHLGFQKGTVLEPAAGIGHIIGLMPEHMASSPEVKVMGVELDSLTGRMLKKLYPGADIQVTGYEEAKRLPDNSVDLVITNVPFGDYPLYDKKRPQYEGWSIHNYFFARAIDNVRPGGIVVAITSHFTMDGHARNAKVRQHLSEKANFLGAIRLPKTAFKSDAGTEVTTDIIILQKKTGDPRQDMNTQAWSAVMKTQDQGQEEVAVNEYFVNHPEMVLGTHSMKGSMRGAKEYTLLPSNTSVSLGEQIRGVIENLPRDIYDTSQTAQSTAKTGPVAEEGLREFAFTKKDGRVYTVEDGVLVEPEWAADKKKMATALDYLDLKAAAIKLNELSLDEKSTDEEIEAQRALLNKIYDNFVIHHHAINHSSNAFLQEDIEIPSVAGLEKVSRKVVNGKTATEITKQAVFTKRTVFPFKEPETAENIEDAIAISHVYRNRIDTDFIGKLLGQRPESVESEILEERKAFRNPETGLLEEPDEYLSGNVREKLNAALAKVEEEPDYQRNVESLEAVLPKPLGIDQIFFQLGSSWIPPTTIQAFLNDILQVEARVEYARSDESASWEVYTDRINSYETVYTQYGMQEMTAVKLLEKALNLKKPVIKMPDPNSDAERPPLIVDRRRTLVAVEKQKQLQEAFKEWGKANAEHGRAMEDIYNSKFNGYVVRKTKEPNIEHYPGASKEVALRGHQKAAVARNLRESNINGHAVGTGKTYIFVTTAMEMRRIGTARKPMIVVQNATVGQYASAFHELYPQARILIPSEKQRSEKYRNRLLSMIATGDYDAVIIPQSFFDMIPNDPRREMAFIEQQIQELRTIILEKERDEGEKSPTVKELRKALLRKMARLQALMDVDRTRTVFFEQMGVDALLIDEAHAYKRGDFLTKMDQVKGIDRDSSQRSSNLRMKALYIQEKTGGKNIILATGTPISNTMTEAWTMLRYCRPDLLKAFNVEQFDDFASTFGTTRVFTEETESGTFKQVERFAQYINGPEFLSFWRAGCDIILKEDLNLPEPKLKGGKIQSVVIQRSPALGRYIEHIRDLKQQWEGLSGLEKMLSRHVPLVLFGQAQKAAIDLRLVDPNAVDDPKSKVNVTLDNVFDRYKEHDATKSTQLIFLDTRRGKDNPGFDLYQDMKKKLTAKGIPAKEIAIINNFTTDDKRKDLFDRVNAGEVRVVIGHTQKLGIGVNVQERLVAIHHIDAPNRPMDYEQRNGRILRQGNLYHKDEVEILTYGVKDTLDSTKFQRLAIKQRFINQALRGDITARTFDEPFDELQHTFDDLLALYSGNPLAPKKIKLENDIRELRTLEGQFASDKTSARNKIRLYEQNIKDNENALPDAEKNARIIEKAWPTGGVSSLEVDGKKFSTPAEVEGFLNGWEDAEKKKIEARFFENEEAKEVRPELTFAFLREDTPEARAVKAPSRMTATINDGRYTFVAKIKPTYKKGAKIGDLVVYQRPEAEWKIFDGKNEIFSSTSGYALYALQRIKDSVAHTKNQPRSMKEGIERMKGELRSLHTYVDKEFDRAEELRAKEEELQEVLAEMAAQQRQHAHDDEDLGDDHMDLEAMEAGQNAELSGDLGELSQYMDEDDGTPGGETSLSFGEESVLDPGAAPRRPQTISQRDQIHAQVKQRMAELSKNWKGVEVQVINTFTDLPSDVAAGVIDSIIEEDLTDAEYESRFNKILTRTEGFYNPKDRKVYIISSNCKTAYRAEEVLLHEAVGHHGLRVLLGEKFTGFLNEVVALKGKAGLQPIADLYGFDLNTQAGRRRAADEMIARMAEKGERPGFLKRLYAEVRQAVRRLGFKVQLTDGDILAMLTKSRKALEAQTTQSPVGERAETSKSLRTERERDSGKYAAPWAMPQSQKLSSADTSINDGRLPATFSTRVFLEALKQKLERGPVKILDIGAGKFNNARDLFNKGAMPKVGKPTADKYRETILPVAQSGKVEYHAYDPFNRPESENRAAKTATAGGQADIVVNNNVLNVIREHSARQGVYSTAADALAPDGVAFFTPYASFGDNVGTETTTRDKLTGQKSTSWQNRVAPHAYLGEVKRYFNDVRLTDGGVIEARNPIKNRAEIEARSVEDFAGWRVQSGKFQNGREVLQNYSGYKIGRGNKEYSVGKVVGSQVYFHKSYLGKMPARVQELAREALKKLPEGFSYNAMMYDKGGASSGERIRFDESPDFDTAREPVSGKMFSAYADGKTKLDEKAGGQIWHHKWQWVGDDYKGFGPGGVDRAYQWSREYLGKLLGMPNGQPKVWQQQLEDHGLAQGKDEQNVEALLSLSFTDAVDKIQGHIQGVPKADIQILFGKNIDIRELRDSFRIPAWLGKTNKTVKAFFDRQNNRDKDRSKLYHGLLEGTQAAFDLKGAEVAEFGTLAFGLENKSVVKAPTYIKIGERPLVKGSARDVVMAPVYALNPEHYTALEAYLKKENVSQPVRQAYVDTRRALDLTWVMALDRLMEIRNIDPDLIAKFRTEMGRIQNYFPHSRYGNYFIRATDPNAKPGAETKYRQHFNALNDRHSRFWYSKNIDKVIADLKKSHPDVSWESLQWEVGKNQQLPEEVYDFPLPIDAMQQIIDAAVDSMPQDEGTREALRKELSKEISDTLKSRGFGSHMIGRKDIPGHETNDPLRVLHDHMSGFSGWLTKMSAAHDFGNMLRDIDAKEKPNEYKWATRFVTDMLQNATQLDRFVDGARTFFFLKYLGLNIKTAFVNLTQNFIAGVPRLSMDLGGALASKGFLRAGSDIRRAITKKGILEAGSERFSQEDRTFLMAMFHEGWGQAQLVTEMRGKVGGPFRKHLGKAAHVMGLPMEIAERFNRMSIGLAAFRAARAGMITNEKTLRELNLAKGEKASVEVAQAFAETVVNDAHFIYGKGNRPGFLRGTAAGKVLSTSYTFRSFSHNLLSMWRWMLFEGGREGQQAFGYSIMAMVALGGIGSLPLYGALAALLRQLFGEDILGLGMRKIIPKGMRDLVMYGAPSALGVDIGGSIGMDLPIVDRMRINQPLSGQLGSGIGELLGIPFAVLEDFTETVDAIRSGRTGRAIETASPTFLKNILSGVRLATEGQTTSSGRPINIPGEVGPRTITSGEAFGKALGFQPLSSTKAYDIHRSIEETKSYRDQKQEELANRYIEAERARNNREMVRIREEARLWNRRAVLEKKPEHKIDLDRSVRARRKARQPAKQMTGLAREYRENFEM